MRRVILLIEILLLFCMPVSAMEFEPPEVPDVGEYYMPDDTESFPKALWNIFTKAADDLLPELMLTLRQCMIAVGLLLTVSLFDSFPGTRPALIHTVSAVMIALVFLEPTTTLIKLGIDTISKMTEYGKLLLPVLTGALAAQGGVTTSSALYSGTVIFSTVLSTLLTNLIIPALYIYLLLSVVKGALEESVISSLQGFIKWVIVWCLKIVLYVFTGYIGITSVISGTVDASALKVTKLTISGMVPVVGGILSEASETILLSAGTMKNATGVYGVIALLATFASPFVKIGAQYLMIKVTTAVCSIFGATKSISVLKDFAVGMGMVLATVGTVCLLLLISVVCFMKGVYT